MRIGVLGAGQLSLMLAEAASRMGVELSIFAENKEAPAARTTTKLHIGKLRAEDLRTFLQENDYVIFESEFVDVPLLREAAAELEVRFFPDLLVMELFQDKLAQKRFCTSEGIPTSRFEAFSGGDVRSWLRSVLEIFQGRLVLKWARLGYDGKRNFFIRGALSNEEDVISFIRQGQSNGGLVYAEELIEFDDELAIVSCRSALDKISHYPVVYSEQSSGICLQVKGPAISFGLPPSLCGEIERISETIGVKGGICGTYAIELFRKGHELYVNEIAPRVHNTGHYTQDASMTSQFENHVRAVLGWELGATESWPFFAMRNILGPEGLSLSRVEPPIPSNTSLLHWYGKDELRPGRKLGHLNTVASSEAELSARIGAMLRDEEIWVAKLSPPSASFSKFFHLRAKVRTRH